ncbi:MAG: hypothetical protein ACE5G1_07220, partial [bacterium]
IHQLGATTYPGGKYQRSRYGHDVFFDYRFVTSAGSQSILYRTQESDFLIAEGLLHTNGDPAAVSAILDKTHVTNGGYASTVGIPVGTINDDPDPKPANRTLWSVLKYEKIIEILGTSSGLEFFEKRGWGDLTSKTLLHFPVPAKDLETLQLPIYTHGGDEGDRAPKYGESEFQSLRPPTY